VRRDPSTGKPPERPSQLSVPLTDRILAVFPGSRWIWIVLWSLLAVPLIYLLLQVIRTLDPSSQALAGGQPGLWQSAAIVNATLLSLWGVHKLAGDLERTGPAITRFTFLISSIRCGWVGSRPAVSAITTSMPLDNAD